MVLSIRLPCLSADTILMYSKMQQISSYIPDSVRDFHPCGIKLSIILNTLLLFDFD